jgi:pimeloyl-ACP methyl ester carboxylesterase
MTILMQNANQEREADWLDIVTFFAESRRFAEARQMLVRSIQKFPRLENQSSQLLQFDQLMADQLFEAAQNAQNVGQHRFAELILENINKSKLSIETQLKVERRLQSIASDKKDRDELMGSVQGDIAKLVDGDTRQQLSDVAKEISENLTADTVNRLSDYRRRRSDATLKPEQLAALAISGWIYGPTVGENNSSVVVSGIKARRFASEYISTPVKNEQLMESISKLESGSPKLMSKILENMPPPAPIPDGSSVQQLVNSKTSPNEQEAMDIPGRFAIAVPQKGRRLGKSVRYVVQLPPEYNPYRRYPCVLSIPGQYSTPEDQIEWWAGSFAPNSFDQRCVGEASRRGYIVISPDWRELNQPSYNFTENEHAAILTPLRDAIRRFSIDTDKIFVSGHFIGGTAAWDLALAHPDMWAGCIAIGARADKYIIQYWENAMFVPSYFVAGELDGSLSGNASIWDKFLERKQIDCLISLYQGRGFDHFQEELPKIMEWMSLPTKTRNVSPKDKEFKTLTSRAGDRFFWWFETEQLHSEKLVHPLIYKAGSEYKIESSINPTANSIRMRSVPAKNYTLWLSPDFVDFSRVIEIDRSRFEPKPDIRVMLEDTRRRADRQHPFWMRIDQ